MRRVFRWAPLVAALAVAAIPLAQHLQLVRAEAWGESFLPRVLEAQREFRRGTGGGFAATLESLTTPCAGALAALAPAEISRARNQGFHVVLRAAEGAGAAAADCHGRPTTTDFYAALEPASAESAPRRAYAVTGSAARIFVFFDGIAPLERDMAPGGLATPLETVGTFRIP